MRKYLLIFSVLLFAMPLIVMAQQANQPAPKINQMNNPGMQNMPCKHCGMMKKGMMMPPISDSEAKNIVNDYIKNNNLKGYSIVSIKKVNSHRGPKYYAELKDSAGNLFNIVIAHGGVVRGPFPTSEIK